MALRPVKMSSIGKMPGFKAAPGRPASNVGKYLLKPVDGSKSSTGFEVLKDKPDTIEMAKEHYLKKYELPPALQPKYLREPQIMANARGKNISKGWLKPRSRQG